MSVTLVVFKEDGSRKDLPLKPGKYVVGRNPDATLRIPLPSVSRAHCEIEVGGSGVSVRDLGSSNGTFSNWSRVEHAKLGAGDVLGIGECVIVVQVDGEPAEVTRPEPPIESSDASADSSMMDTSGAVKPAPSKSAPAKDSPGDDTDFDFSFLDDDDNPTL